MKKLFIYYSHTGNLELVSEVFEKKGYEIRRVFEKKKMPKSFFLSMLVGGFRAGIHAKGKLVNYDNDVSGYDEIVIASPIWNGRLTPAINSVLNQLDLKNKKVSFVLSAGGGEAPKAIKVLNKKFGDIKIVVLKDPKKYQEELAKLKDF